MFFFSSSACFSLVVLPFIPNRLNGSSNPRATVCPASIADPVPIARANGFIAFVPIVSVSDPLTAPPPAPNFNALRNVSTAETVANNAPEAAANAPAKIVRPAPPAAIPTVSAAMPSLAPIPAAPVAMRPIVEPPAPAAAAAPEAAEAL